MPTSKATKKPKPVRLFKVLSELNVSADRVVKTLETKGYELDGKLASGNPNAKLPPEMYATLLETYAEDAEAKARVQELRAQLNPEPQSSEVEPEPPEVEPEEAHAEEDAPTEEKDVVEASAGEPGEEPDKEDDPDTEETAPVVRADADTDEEALAEEKDNTSDADSQPALEVERDGRNVESGAGGDESSETTVEATPDTEAPSPEVRGEVAGEVTSPDSEADEVEDEEGAPEKVDALSAEADRVEKMPEAAADDEVPGTAAEDAEEPESGADETARDKSGEAVAGEISADKAAAMKEGREAGDTDEAEKTDGKAGIDSDEATSDEAEPEEVASDEDGSDEDGSDEDGSGEAEDEEDEGEGVMRAGRYRLTGTSVVGKVDLSSIDTGRRRRRKKKKGGSSDSGSSGTSGGRKKKGRKKKSKKVDQAEVEQNVQQTLQEIKQGADRTRQRRRRDRREEREAEREAASERMAEEANTLQVLEYTSTGELAEVMGVPVTDVISKGFELGMMVSINQRLDADQITLIADEFDFDVEFMTEQDEDLMLVEEEAEDEADLEPRTPVVTIMGHVDHGKTSLLDYIRRANVVAGEAGGITQHIGAYEVTLDDGRRISFLDTPGHEAFTAMRARGAQVTDIVILVVAADDRVMPQTIEAINHAKAAEVPLVVAINKMDREEANEQRIMAELAEQNVLVEQYGGQVQAELISALNGDNVDELLDKVLLEAELLELRANPNRRAVGTVIESRLEKGRGVVSTILVQTGTLRDGDSYVVGAHYGRVRAMFDERDNRVSEAGPSTPVQVIGFEGQPEVGDRLVVMEEERDARDIAAKREQMHREQMMQQRRRTSLADLSRRMKMETGDVRELNLVVKADVGGSVEALADSLLKIANEEVAVNIVHSGVGAITESDVMLAAASDAIVIGFQVRPVPGVRGVAEREEIDIRTYSVIYDAIQEVRSALEGLLAPEVTEEVTSTLEIRDTFRTPNAGTVAGCYVVEGTVSRNDKVRLLRDGVVVYDGEIGSLRRFKDDVKEVATGYECGLSIQNFNDIKVGDTLEAYKTVEQARTLEV